MKKIGVVSIRPKIDPTSMTFGDAYKSVGLNTGNLMFTTAIFDQIDGDVTHVGFQFSPEAINAKYDALVIPAANWLGSHAQWDWFADLIDKVEIPVITIGIGAQASDSQRDKIDWNDSSLRLARTLASKAPYLSTRGHYTTSCLQQLGILNVVSTGCPSIYMDFPRVDVAREDALVVQSTRYAVSKVFAETASVNQALFQMAFEHRLDMVYQSEPEEMQYLLKKSSAQVLNEKYKMAALCTLYGADTPEALLFYLDRHGKLFYDLAEWSRYLQTRSGVLGTRLHGSILALNSGVPSVLIPHDSRTAEMVRFADIPTAGLRSFPWPDREMAHIPEIMDQVARYEQTRASNKVIYRQFLAANGLSDRFGEAAAEVVAAESSLEDSLIDD